jgi:PAS domain S-box-containing protein
MEPDDGKERIRALLGANPKGMTIEEVSKTLSLNRTTAAKYLNSLLASGQAEVREVGRAKIFFPANRVPFADLLDLSSDLILVLDDELYVSGINQAFLTCFRVSKKEVKGRRIDLSVLAQYFTGDQVTLLMEALGGTPAATEMHCSIQSEDRYFSMRITPLVTDDGKPSVALILTDITRDRSARIRMEDEIRTYSIELVRIKSELEEKILERTQASATLAKNERILRSMFDAIPAGVGLLVDRKLKNVNGAFCELTGYSEEELVGNDSRFLYADEADYIRANRELYWPIEKKRSATMETSFRKKDGSLIDVVITLCPFDPGNPGEGVTATIVDITDRKRNEEALRKAHAQVALLTSVTRHDILNQLTNLRGYIGFLKQFTFDEKVTEILCKEEMIANNIWNQAIYTRDYQNIGSRSPEWVNVTDTLAGIRKTMDLRDIAIDVDTGSTEIYVDPLVRKVFTYLIENSVQHGKTVTDIRISRSEKEGGLSIIYADNGIGIADEEKEKIFEREYGKNHGLGLALIRDILEVTGIRICENGKAGEGARFEILVPEGSYRDLHGLKPGVSDECHV